MLEEFYNQELVWITLINSGYVEFTMNFLESMKKAKCKFKLIIYYTDEFVAPRLSKYDNCVCISADKFLKSLMSVKAHKWEQLEYKRICFAKLDAIQYTCDELRNNGVKHVGFIDTDIVLFSDPSPIVINYLKEHTDCKVLAQCDEAGEFCSFKNGLQKCPNICSGVIVFNLENEYDSLFRYDTDVIPHFSGDQAYIQHGIDKAGIECHTVPKSVFMNGGFKFAWKLPRPKDSCLLHFNYLVGGPMKKKKMMKMRMWYL